MDRFKQIETFVAVVAKGSLSAAALAEGVAPAVIGRRLDALEERLGVKLLVRTTRRLTLTFEGSAFLEDCQRVIHDMQSAEASVSAGGVKASGHLRVSAPAGFGRRHVAALGERPRTLLRHGGTDASVPATLLVGEQAGVRVFGALIEHPSSASLRSLGMSGRTALPSGTSRIP